MDDTGTTHSLLPREIRPGVLVCPDAPGVARVAARQFVEWAWQFIARKGEFHVALSGGNTPRALYRMLASSEFRPQVDWARVHIFWGDERAVPPDHPDSNYGMARGELLVRVPIPPANVHRMEADRRDLGRAAQDYENVLRQYLERDSRGFPRFHLILLGMGADGHTASLFPGPRRLQDTSRWVSTPMVSKLNSRRMTLTLPVLNSAYEVLFLVVGADKAPALRQVVEGTSDPPLPTQLITVPDGRRTFLVDEPAATLLGPPTARRDESNSSRTEEPGDGQARGRK